jgi:hypothetical protein
MKKIAIRLTHNSAVLLPITLDISDIQVISTDGYNDWDKLYYTNLPFDMRVVDTGFILPQKVDKKEQIKSISEYHKKLSAEVISVEAELEKLKND